MTEQTETIPSADVFNALRRMRIDPYGVTSVTIDTEWVTVTRDNPEGGAAHINHYRITRQGLG